MPPVGSRYELRLGVPGGQFNDGSFATQSGHLIKVYRISVADLSNKSFRSTSIVSLVYLDDLDEMCLGTLCDYELVI
jgi:hypothetical protein